MELRYETMHKTSSLRKEVTVKISISWHFWFLSYNSLNICHFLYFCAVLRTLIKHEPTIEKIPNYARNLLNGRENY